MCTAAGDVIWRPLPPDSRRTKSGGAPQFSGGGDKGGSRASSKSSGSQHGSDSDDGGGGGGSATSKAARGEGSQGVFVVLHGIVRSAYAAPDSTTSVSAKLDFFLRPIPWSS